MKKAGIALVSILLAGSMFAFAGCDNNEEPEKEPVRSLGAIEGNFEEVDSATAARVLGAFDFEHAFDSFATGVSVKQTSEFNLGLNVQLPLELIQGFLPMVAASSSSASSYVSIAGTASLSSTALATVDAAGETVKAKQQTEASYDIGGIGKGEVGVTAYVDEAYVYLSEEGITGEDFSIKVSLEDIMSYVGGVGGVGGVMAADADVSASPEEGMDLASMVTMVYTYGGVVSLDQTDGLKVRLSLDNKFFASVVASVVAAYGPVGGMDTVTTTILNAITISDTSLIEIAVAFDEDGQFVEYGVAMDLSVTLDGTKLNGIGGTITISGKEKTEITTETVTLPANLATDYEEVTVDEIMEYLGSMMGGSGSSEPDQPAIKDKEVA